MNRETVNGLLEELRQVIRETVREELSAHISKLQVLKEKDVTQDTPKASVGGIELPATEQLQAKDLRLALLLGKLPEDSGALIDTDTTAKLLGIAGRTLEKLVASQSVPSPIRISGRIVRWRLTELLEWIEAGCPHPKHWSYSPNTPVLGKRRK